MPIEPLRRPLDATVTVPGSKSLTNRALLCAAMATGTSTLRGVLDADDTDAMAGALAALGIAVERDLGSAWAIISGCGGRPPNRTATIDARQSGTTARFLLPVLGALPGDYRVDGSPQLRARPMGELLDAVRRLGAGVSTADGGASLPATVGGGFTTNEVSVRGDITSQFLSGLMLAAPLTENGLVIECTTEVVSAPYIALTAEVMACFGAGVDVGDRRITVGSGGYVATEYTVEPDASTAAYFFAAAALAGGTVRVEGMSMRSSQGDVRFVEVLERMGARPVERDGAIEVSSGGGRVRGIDVDLRDMPDMALTVAALAPFADSPTTVSGVEIIRGHESDRIAVVASELSKVGARVEERPDGFVVHPVPEDELRAAVIDSHDDHRVAMALALLGLRIEGIEISGPECVSKTFPGYWRTLASLRTR